MYSIFWEKLINLKGQGSKVYITKIVEVYENRHQFSKLSYGKYSLKYYFKFFDFHLYKNGRNFLELDLGEPSEEKWCYNQININVIIITHAFFNLVK